MTKLYIAYGSNLNKSEMRRRCPSAKPLGGFLLTDARLVFRGVADVEYAAGEKVPCGLWSINRADERSLDAYEGVNSGFYFKDETIKLKFAGRPQNALIYLMRSQGIYPPSKGYVARVLRGYKDFKLDEKYLEDAITRSFLEKDPDEQTRSRRERQKKDPIHAELVKMPAEVALKKLDLVRAANWNDVREAASATEN